jgi:hypothetical protein
VRAHEWVAHDGHDVASTAVRSRFARERSELVPGPERGCSRPPHVARQECAMRSPDGRRRSGGGARAARSRGLPVGRAPLHLAPGSSPSLRRAGGSVRTPTPAELRVRDLHLELPSIGAEVWATGQAAAPWLECLSPRALAKSVKDRRSSSRRQASAPARAAPCNSRPRLQLGLRVVTSDRLSQHPTGR